MTIGHNPWLAAPAQRADREAGRRAGRHRVVRVHPDPGHAADALHVGINPIVAPENQQLNKMGTLVEAGWAVMRSDNRI